ncbi:hypothetical protein [Cohaesibacter celericrescens]|uniref:Uncharacterized protein n=1 Tax=Cohaesibacter celericrescens TaxID=2067669 RepID=A0A2N5XR53_9HYPH|nr:hypothetical protein [Cohaesibacter celericrescens]PLW76945.1 hypothetical protein C0081_12935 [Cohaesibacter celericrescens]
MAGIEKLREKLSLYLSTLSDSAQGLLLRSLEKSQRDGTSDAASDMILAALNDILKENTPDIPLEKYAKKEFFRAAAVFTSGIDHVRKTQACISPSSHDVIWAWVMRDIVTAEQKAKLQKACNGLSDDELVKQGTALRDELVPAISKYLKSVLNEMGGEQKIANHLGGVHVYHDLIDILACGEQLSPLAPILSRMPAQLSSWSTPEGEEIYKLVSKYTQQAPMKACWLFSAISKRLSSQKLKIQLATKLGGSDDAIQVAATVYAPAIVQVLADMEANLAQFEKCLSQPSEFETCLRHLSTWRSLAKYMDAEMDISVQCAWGKAITSMKTKLSELLETEIESTPGLVRKALRAPKNGAQEFADQNLLQDAERAVLLFHNAERMKDCIALNGPIGRIRKELDQSFEILTTSLIERTRLAVGSDAEICKVLGETAVIFAKNLFDDAYAAAFRRQLKAAASVQEMRAAEA